MDPDISNINVPVKETFASKDQTETVPGPIEEPSLHEKSLNFSKGANHPRQITAQTENESVYCLQGINTCVNDLSIRNCSSGSGNMSDITEVKNILNDMIDNISSSHPETDIIVQSQRETTAEPLPPVAVSEISQENEVTAFSTVTKEELNKSSALQLKELLIPEKSARKLDTFLLVDHNKEAVESAPLCATIPSVVNEETFEKTAVLYIEASSVPTAMPDAPENDQKSAYSATANERLCRDPTSSAFEAATESSSTRKNGFCSTPIMDQRKHDLEQNLCSCPQDTDKMLLEQGTDLVMPQQQGNTQMISDDGRWLILQPCLHLWCQEGPWGFELCMSIKGGKEFHQRCSRVMGGGEQKRS